MIERISVPVLLEPPVLAEMACDQKVSKEERLKLIYDERTIIVNYLASIDWLIAQVEAEAKKEKIPMSLIDTTPGLRDYLECALWSSTDDNDEPFDKNYTLVDIAESTVLNAYYDLTQMCELADLTCIRWEEFWDTEQFAHDFWLTRNGHGAGFWCRYSDDDGYEIGERLSDIARTFGNLDPVLGDDGKIYFE